MKRNAPLFVLAAAALWAAGARAQAPAPGQPMGSDSGQAAAPAKDSKKAAWQNGVKADCAAEIAPGGICAGKDFGTGLEKCLEKNRKKLSDGCRVATRHRHRRGGWKGHKKDGDDQAQPDASQAPAPPPPSK